MGAMIATAYTRKSNTEGQVLGELRSVEQQRAEIEKFIAQRGWQLGPIFEDNEISGEEWNKRPGYQALRAALSPRPKFQVVVVWEQSRFGRDVARQLMAITEITEAGVEVWSVKDGGRKLTSRDIVTLVGAWKAEEDNAETRDRVNRAHAARFEKNLVTGGSVFGYTNERVPGVDKAVRRAINPKERNVVVRIFELTAKGQGRRKIAKTLQNEGVKSPVRITAAGRIRRERKNLERIERGETPLPEIKEAWTSNGVTEILNRELYRGVVIYGRIARGWKRGEKR